MEQIGFSRSHHGTGRRARLMYMKMVNGQRKKDTKSFNSSVISAKYFITNNQCGTSGPLSAFDKWSGHVVSESSDKGVFGVNPEKKLTRFY